MGSKTILVVEDDISLREVFVMMIEMDGHKAIEAENGKHALEILGHTDKRPDCILLDLMMPIMDGKTFIQNIKTMEAHNDIPIIVCSAQGDFETTPQVYTRMDKPVDLNVLGQTIKECLKLS